MVLSLFEVMRVSLLSYFVMQVIFPILFAKYLGIPLKCSAIIGVTFSINLFS